VCGVHVPDVLYFSEEHALIIMEYIAPPNMILRKGLMTGIRYPKLAMDMAKFCAHTLFQTSAFALTASQLRRQVQFWSTNIEMCALTEQVVFSEPFRKSDNNRWTTPHLDAHKVAIETDTVLRQQAAVFKLKFITETQALIHGDLHSGSVMCSPEHTYIIDPEFAFYGPMVRIMNDISMSAFPISNSTIPHYCDFWGG
jgi:5-methylthioribose kinase